MSKKRFTARDISLIGAATALVVLCTLFLKVQGPTGMIHFGSAALFTAAALLGGVYAAIAGALGSLLFDMLSGQLAYTLWSFFIKGIAGYAVGAAVCGAYPRKLRAGASRLLLRVFLGCLAGLAINAAGYFLAWWQVLGDVRVALANVYLYSLPTSVIGTAAACALAVPLRAALEKSDFYRD